MIDIVGYDLDGVICPDICWDGSISDDVIDKLFEIRNALPPIFKPSGEFVIITGRPSIDFDRSNPWLERNNIHPIYTHYLIVDKTKWSNDMAIQHKASWINYYSMHDSKYKMIKYFESDKEQTLELQKLCSIPIYCFPDFISMHSKGKKL